MRKYTTRARAMFAIGSIAVLTLSGCNGGNFQSPLSPAVDVTPTPPPPPPTVPAGGFTISGVVFEVVDGVSIPLEGVHVEDSSRHWSVLTAEDGSYTIRGVELIPFVGGPAVSMFFAKNGYASTSVSLLPAGEDTRLDVRLLRK